MRRTALRRAPCRRIEPPRRLRFALFALAALVPALFVAVGSAQADEALEATAFRGYDPMTDSVLEPLTDGSTLVAGSAGESSFGVLVETSPDVASVRFSIDGHPVGVDDEAPFTLTLEPRSTGGFVPVAQARTAMTLEARVNDTRDDAEEFTSASASNAERFPEGYTYTQSSDLELGRDPDHGPQAIGLRFDDVAIPAGATITSAHLRFVARGTSEGATTVAVRAESSADPAAFEQDVDGEGSRGLTSRPTTSAQIEWEVSEPWASGGAYRSPNLASVVQEVVDAAAWSEGSTLSFILSASAQEGFRRAYSFDEDPEQAPVLEVTYTIEASASDEVRSFPWGQHVLRATPFAEPGASGAEGEASSVALRFAAQPEDVSIPEPEAEATSDPNTQEGAGAEAEPMPDGAATDDDVGSEGEVASPETEPEADAPDIGGSEDASVERARFPLAPRGDAGVRGSALVSSYPGRSTVITVSLDAEPTESYVLELWGGTCDDPAQRLAELAPYRSSIGSVTPVAIGFATLRVGTFSVRVMLEDGGVSIGCADLGAPG